ncbi:putative Corticosteroid 11-beta-dehydrogenase [Tripterygium wilfordii]|uniref:Putative Corticosteroid 11-beta-dehydrogenase n=1 Tax=Tripterygium wilfordii TaxID=458696 RepID=A0A7J7BYU3_TRIWF|nr:11-beta-hydroxysteroid dehydrogenase B-like [Tripterygium wilfordii]KAF5727069.1 putative Corticosteroid 11-beta-dehydrogenase [Tripterygium wilfordii]
MDLRKSLLNLVVPPASMVMLACAWPALIFIRSCEWIYGYFNNENMEDKVVIITGASSGMGEQIAYEYAKRKAKLVLVARRDQRLRLISENASLLGANHVMIAAADVVKENDCRSFVTETINYYGSVDHLVLTTSLGHTFYIEEVTDTSVFPHILDINFWGNVYPTLAALPYLHQSNGRIIVNASVENWLPLPRMSLYAAAKAALINFYESLRSELNDEVGITIATHGWVGMEMSRGKFLLEEGAEMQWKEEREVHVSGGPVEDYARMIVDAACRGEAYVKFSNWHDIFPLYRAFVPNLLNWTLQLLIAQNGTRRTSLIGTGRPLLEGASPRKLLVSPAISHYSPQQQQKME